MSEIRNREFTKNNDIKNIILHKLAKLVFKTGGRGITVLAWLRHQLANFRLGAVMK